MSDPYRQGYPLGLPYQPPTDLVRREARLRRWVYGLLTIIALFLVSASAAGVLAARYLSEQAEGGEGPAAPPPEVAETGGPAPAAKEEQAGHEKARSNADSSHGDSGHGDTSQAARPSPATVKVKLERDLFLQSTAVLTVSYLYQAYLNIGLLADAREHDVYTKAEGLIMLDEQIGTLVLIDAQLGKIQGTALEAPDQKDVGRVRAVCATLKTLAQELKAYWKEPKKDRESRYRKARETAWAGIKPLLGDG